MKKSAEKRKLLTSVVLLNTNQVQKKYEDQQWKHNEIMDRWREHFQNIFKVFTQTYRQLSEQKQSIEITILQLTKS